MTRGPTISSPCLSLRSPFYWFPRGDSTASCQHLPVLGMPLPTLCLAHPQSWLSCQLKCFCLKDGDTRTDMVQFLFLGSSQMSSRQGHKVKYDSCVILSAVVEVPCTLWGHCGNNGNKRGYGGWCLKSKEKGSPNRTLPSVFM